MLIEAACSRDHGGHTGRIAVLESTREFGGCYQGPYVYLSVGIAYCIRLGPSAVSASDT
jgi:hypothetical protein